MEAFSLNYLNAIFKNPQDFGKYLEKVKNISLPDIKKDKCSTAYLLKVARGEVITIPKDTFKNYRGHIPPLTRAELNELLMKEGGMPTGFEDNMLPSKKWLVDCLYSLNPKHPIFQDNFLPQETVALPAG